MKIKWIINISSSFCDLIFNAKIDVISHIVNIWDVISKGCKWVATSNLISVKLKIVYASPMWKQIYVHWGGQGPFPCIFGTWKLLWVHFLKMVKHDNFDAKKVQKQQFWETRWYQQSYQKSDFPEVKSNPIFMMRHQIEVNTLAYDMHICLYWWNECMGAQLDRKVPDFSLTRRKQHRIQTVS